MSKIKINIFIPLSGRKKCWKKISRYLTNQIFPKDQISLHLLDTSNDIEFNSILRKWIAKCEYNVELKVKTFTNTKKLADLPRAKNFNEVNQIMCQIYNCAKCIKCDVLFIIEDDVIPPLDDISRLLKSLSKDVLCVSGSYKMKTKDVWNIWTNLDEYCVKEKQYGVKTVEATGFGCLLIWGKDFSESEITWNNIEGTWRGFDMEFFSKQKKKILCDWDVVCEHCNESDYGVMFL